MLIVDESAAFSKDFVAFCQQIDLVETRRPFLSFLELKHLFKAETENLPGPVPNRC